MKILQIKNIEAHLQGNQAFIYADDSSDILYIDNIEEKTTEEAEALIVGEIEYKNSGMLSSAVTIKALF